MKLEVFVVISFSSLLEDIKLEEVLAMTSFDGVSKR
mgnify:CR=1 FL=1